MYEIMRYWDDDQPDWGADEHAFAAAWRSQPKWVVSRTLKSVGPNASLVGDDLERAIRELKYRIYLHPVVLGAGKPYFAGPRPPLRLLANDPIAEDVIRLTYGPA
jgi:hypothetical protein